MSDRIKKLLFSYLLLQLIVKVPGFDSSVATEEVESSAAKERNSVESLSNGSYRKFTR